MLNRSRTVLFTSLALVVGMALVGCSSQSCGLVGGGGVGSGAGSSSVSATLMLVPEYATGGVGVVRRNDLLIAYYGSIRHAEDMQTLKGLLVEAEGAGREADAAAITAYGEAMQEVAHRQLAGSEPIYTVLVGVEDELRALMDRHNLNKIVEAGPGIEGLDITDDLVTMLAQR